MINKDIAYTFTMPQPQTELSNICCEVAHIAEQDPKIVEMIAHDQDCYAREEKKLRIQDKQWKQNQLTPFAELEPAPGVEIDAEKLTLQQGKKKMAPRIVLLFLILRGYIGGFKAKTTQTLLMESITIHNFLEQCGISMPGWSTIIENVNQVSNKTRSYILDAQLWMVLEEKLDDLKELTIDSTAVSGNVSWPTDSGIILQLVERIWRLGQKLDHFGIGNIAPKRFASIIQKLRYFHKTICMSAGKKNSRQKIKKLYNKALKEARSALSAFEKEMVEVNHALACVDIPPTKLLQLERMVELMNNDVKNLGRVIDYCTDRIRYEIVKKANEKVMSNSDNNAAFIQKGQREAVIGYKPQIGRSKKGLISCFSVPEGNAADSIQLEPMVDQHIRRTRVIPYLVNVDDGYASAKGKQKVELKGVTTVSINGSKGKKITSDQDWESELFKEARNNRSSVESLMFTIKHNHNFGQVMRRGIVQVRAELMEKVLAYNFCRMIELRKRKAEPEVSEPEVRHSAA